MREIVRSDEHAATFVSLGVKPEFFGTHSLGREQSHLQHVVSLSLHR